jgi:hypothetical protein
MYAVQELGHAVVDIKYRPFGGTDYSPLDEVKGPLVFFGSLNMIRDFQSRNLPFKPFAWCDWYKMSCKCYYARYSSNIVQEQHEFIELGKLEAEKDRLFSVFGEDDKIFIRPDQNDKCFIGTLVKSNMFDTFMRCVTACEPPMDTLCVVSTPKRIDKEWRFVIADKKVIAGSLYYDDHCLTMDGNYDMLAAEFAEKMCEIWTPDPMFIMDIALVNGEYKIMEIGPVNGAGLYKCEILPVIKAMSEIGARTWEE